MSLHETDFSGAVRIEKKWVKPHWQTTYDPDAWDDPTVSKDCYTYGTNIPEIGEGAIGHIGGIDIGGADISSPEKVKALLRQDELSEHKVLPQDGSHVIAVFWTPKGKQGRPDFHVYRRDANPDGSYGKELWSHLFIKGDGCGATARPSQLDHSGNPITDPTKCDHGNDDYVFVGYYAFGYDITNTDSPGLQIVPKVEVDPDLNTTTFTTHNNPVVNERAATSDKKHTFH